MIRQHLPIQPKASGKQPLLFRELEQHCEYRYSALVTNDTELTAEWLWRTYRPRANEENCIKELKEGYGWHQFNVRSFWGTLGGDALDWDGLLQPGASVEPMCAQDR